MNRTTNPLNEFRSYSYYHVLIACDTTAVAEELSRSIEVTDFQHDPDSIRYAARTKKSGKYVVVINGSTDAEYNIESVKWATVFAPSGNVGGVKEYSTFAVDGELVITEPLGINFLNVLSNVGATLKTDPNALVYLLKTIFIGHTDGGVTKTYIETKPLLFVPFDIESETELTGSRYTFSIAGVNDGAAKMPQVSRIAEGLTLKIPRKATTLKSFLEGPLTTALNDKVANFNKNLKKFVEKNQIDIPVDRFKKVKYRIEVDDVYDGKEFYVGTNTKEQSSDTGTNNDAILTVGNSPTVEHMIDQIMQSCKGVLDEATPKLVNGERTRYIYKISSVIDSTNGSVDESETTSCDDASAGTAGTYTVVFRVWHYKMETQEINKPKDIKPKPGEFVEWDYIYTGKNTDVLDFKIKMEMGMAFFQTLGTRQSVLSQSQILGNTEEGFVGGGAGGPKKGDNKECWNYNTPLFPGTGVRETLLRNKRYPISTANFAALMQRHAAYENIGVNITVRGNPILLSEQIVSPREIIEGKVTEAKEKSLALVNWVKTPGLAKLNIKMPSREAVDSNFRQGKLESFWYNGFYMILSANNIFSDGQFTQEFELYSIPLTSELQKQNDPVSTEEQKMIAEFRTENGKLKETYIIEFPDDNKKKHKDGEKRLAGDVTNVGSSPPGFESQDAVKAAAEKQEQ